jgi:lipid-A-disaccharide synthase
MTLLMISAAEASGDHHAAQLIKKCPGINFIGMGGSLSQQAGLETLVNSNDLGAVGITEIFQKLTKNIKALNTLKQELKNNKDIEALIVFDCPEFNLRLAKYAKKNIGIKIIYIAPPQIWAWRKHRIHTIKKYIDHIVCLFPFEPKFYHRHNISHSLAMNPSMAAMDQRPLFKYDSQAKTIALLPGSRSSEIKNHLNLMIKAIRDNLHLHQHIILVIGSDSCQKNIIDSIIQNHPSVKHIPRNKCNNTPVSFAIAASGTVCLELALCEIPFGVVYKLSNITIKLLRLLRSIGLFSSLEYFSLPNIITNKLIVPELTEEIPSHKNVYQLVEKLSQRIYQEKLIGELKTVRRKLNHNDGTMDTILLKWLSSQPSL